MARRRRHRRHYRDMVVVPGLGQLLEGSASTKQILTGAALGLGVIGLSRWAMRKFGAGKVPDSVLNAQPVLLGAAAAAALYFAEKKKNSAKAKAWAFGAAFTGAAVSAWSFLQKNSMTSSFFADAVTLRYAGLGNVYINNPAPIRGLGSMYVNNPAPYRGLGSGNSASNLAALAQYAMANPAHEEY